MFECARRYFKGHKRNKAKQKCMLRVMIETGQIGERVREKLFTVVLKLYSMTVLLYKDNLFNALKISDKSFRKNKVLCY